MGKPKYITHRQRKAASSVTNDGNQEKPKNVTKWLDSTKNENQTITNAIQEVGPTKPGNGLMLGQTSNLTVNHERYFNFLTTIEPIIKGFARDKEIKITDYNFNDEGRKSIALRRVDDSSEGVFMLTTSIKGFGSKIWGNYKDGQNCEIEFEPGSIGDQSIRSIVVQLHNSKKLRKYHKTNSFTVEKLIEHFQRLIKRSQSSQIQLKQDIEKSNLTEECKYSIKTAATTALGLTTTSSISTNDSSEQGDHTDIGMIVAAVVGTVLAVIGVGTAVRTIINCYYKKCYRTGTYRAGEEGEPQEKADDHTHNNKHSLPTTEEKISLIESNDDACEISRPKSDTISSESLVTINSKNEETEPLLQDHGQSDSGINVTHGQFTGMQQALKGKWDGSSGSKERSQKSPKMEKVRAEVHVVKEDVKEQHEDSSSLPHTIPKIIGAIPKKQLDPSKNEQEKYEERGKNAGAVFAELKIELKNKNLGEGVTIPLHAITNTTVTNAIPIYQQNMLN